MTSWIDVTARAIRDETSSYVGVVPPSAVDVSVDVRGQSFRSSSSISQSRMLGGGYRRHRGHAHSTTSYRHGPGRRDVQSSTLPLAIEFDTTLRFRSDRGDWDEGEMVGGGFRTRGERTRYILDLRVANPTHFDNLNGMALDVEGEPVTVMEPGAAAEPNGNNSMYYIVAGAAGGFLLLLLAALAIVYYRRRRRRDERDDPAMHVQVVEVDKDGGAERSRTDDADTHQNTINRQSYFGTIEQIDIEDVSTLGDPYLGEFVNPGMNADITVGERYGSCIIHDAFFTRSRRYSVSSDPTFTSVSHAMSTSLISKQEQLFIYGVGRPHAGTGAESRMGDTTVTGSKAMLFGEDTTLEGIYRTPEGVGAPPALDFVTVVAPAGMMGIVLDNPSGDLPVVHAIKDSSPLHGRIFVGDLLVSVDELDCRGMSPRAISSFLSSRSQNHGRTLVLARDSS
jgi:hypothetical protein